MNIKLLIFVIVILLCDVALAIEPVALFAQELIAKRSDEVWFVSSDERATVPKGGYLYRFDLDLNGDGQMEVFVATSLDVDRSRLSTC